MAFASTSQAGRNPNMVISPKNTYEVGDPFLHEHSFTVDLNDNASLGSLEIQATDVGYGLNSFLVQTGMNGRDWTTVASSKLDLHPIPKAEGLPESVAVPKVWNPSVVVMNDTDRYQMGGRSTVYDLDELQKYLDRDWLQQQFPRGPRGMSAVLRGDALDIPTARSGNVIGGADCPHVVWRFRGWFYEPTDVARRFRLDLGGHDVPEGTHPSLISPPKFLLAVDGRPIASG